MASNEDFFLPVSFYFKITIAGFDAESDFQEVTGLTMSIDTVALNEGGQNLYVHNLPIRAKPERLVLKRGLKVSSDMANWCREAIEEFSFRPKDIQISLLDPRTQENQGPQSPLASWYLTNAFPVKWSVSNFNAMNNEVAIETIELQYHRFTKSFPK
jgi:phage tail-like protein